MGLTMTNIIELGNGQDMKYKLCHPVYTMTQNTERASLYVYFMEDKHLVT